MTDQISNQTEADPVFKAAGFIVYQCPKCKTEHAFVSEDDVFCPCGAVFTTDLITLNPVPMLRLWFNPVNFTTVIGYVKEG